MNVDDLLANPGASLPQGAIPVHALVIIEYVNPSDDDDPCSLYVDGDDALMSWQAGGMLLGALDRERVNAVTGFVNEDDA
jgi:hypothetical protein